MPTRFTRSLPAEEHLRQLRKVYGPLGPAFISEELNCTLDEALQHLYPVHADPPCWVRLSDVARVAGRDQVHVQRWMQPHHIPCPPKGKQVRTGPTLLHLEDAKTYLAEHLKPYPSIIHPAVEYLPRWASLWEQPAPATTPAARERKDVDWHLAQRAAWPMTVERLAEAVYGSREASAQRKARNLARAWEAQGRITCFARGLYDLIRPELILDPEGYGRRALPRAEIQALRQQHPELRHWPAGPLAAAWRAYSRLYGAALLPVLDRREPALLEYLMVRQLHPAEGELQLGSRYDELCRETTFYRLVAAPTMRQNESSTFELTVENIEAGLIDFGALAQMTRRRLQAEFEHGRKLGQNRRAAASEAP